MVEPVPSSSPSVNDSDGHRFWLAPVRGVTDAAWRTHFDAIFGGFEHAISPFLVQEKHRPVREKDLRDAVGGPIPVIPQVLAGDASELVELAGKLAAIGCEEVNWNLGCPYPMVVKRGRGAGLLRDPGRIRAILDEAVPRMRCRLSVKMRVGCDLPTEAVAVLRVLGDYPLASLIIHPRTAGQMYGGSVDLEAFAACLPETRHPVIYNGDITTPAFAAMLRGRFPNLRQWMIGRGALANPWLIREIRGNAPAMHPMTTLRGFHDRMLDHYQNVLSGPGHVLDKMLAWWGWLAPSIDAAGRTTKRLLKSKSLASYRDSVDKLFASEPRWAPPH